MSACSQRGSARVVGFVSVHPLWVGLIIRAPSVAAGPGVAPAAEEFSGTIPGVQQHCGIPRSHPWQTAPGQECTVAPSPAVALQSHLPHIPAQNQMWGLLIQHLQNRPCPRQGCDSQRAKRGTHPISTAGSHHHNTKHTPSQWDNDQHTLRKDMAGIHTKNSPRTKNTGLTQSTQGSSHRKTALQDHSR